MPTRESAPPDQAERFFGGLAKVRQQAADSRPQAIVFMTGEHFTNFFLQNLPQIAVGLGMAWAPVIRGRWRSG